MVRDRRYRGGSTGHSGELVYHVLRVRLGSASCEACLVGGRLNEDARGTNNSVSDYGGHVGRLPHCQTDSALMNDVH